MLLMMVPISLSAASTPGTGGMTFSSLPNGADDGYSFARQALYISPKAAACESPSAGNASAHWRTNGRRFVARCADMNIAALICLKIIALATKRKATQAHAPAQV